MTPHVVPLILLAAAGYTALGVAFAVLFVARGAATVDPAARGAPWSFRVIILPGVAALWPVMLAKWLAARRGARP